MRDWQGIEALARDAATLKKTCLIDMQPLAQASGERCFVRFSADT